MSYGIERKLNLIKCAKITQYLRHTLGFDQMNKNNPVQKRRLGFDQMNGMNAYDFLYMVSSVGGTNSNTTCLGEEVNDLMEMDEVLVKPILILLGKK